MASKNTLTGGGFQDALGNVVANGYMLFSLSQDAQVNGTTQIAAGFTVKINLDASGNIISGQTIWPNDVLSPNGTFYNVSVFSSVGQLVWGPNAQQVLSSPSPFNVGVWIPAAVNIGLGGGGVGTVNSFSFTNGGGFVGTVTNPTTNPNLSLVLSFLQIGTTSVANNVLSFSNTTGLVHDSGVNANDIVLRSSNNQFGNTVQTFGLTGSGEIQIGNSGITVIDTSLATVATIDTATGTGLFTSLATKQTPASTTTASDRSIPIVCDGTTFYVRLSTTP